MKKKGKNENKKAKCCKFILRKKVENSKKRNIILPYFIVTSNFHT